MTKYTSKDNLLSGVHLGGIGCGTLQIFPDGTRGAFTGLNNWERPLGNLHWFRKGPGGDYRAANPFAIFVQSADKSITKLLQTTSLDSRPHIERIEFIGEFPIARLEFYDREIPLKIELTAFSSFIKEDYKNSGLPAATYLFKVTNPTKKAITVSLLASAINPVGAWNVGRINKIKKENGLLSINFYKRHAHPQDASVGTITLATAQKGNVSYLCQWPCASKPFSGKLEDRRFQAWESFSIDGTLPNRKSGKEARGEMDEWMGALAVKFTLAPGESKEIPFYYTWHMPKHFLGHRYQLWFKDSFQVASYIDRNKQVLLKKTLKWQDLIKTSSLPDWLNDALINNLYVYTSASWWTKKGEFALYENTVKYPLMDSLDVRYYGTIPLALFFPELEKSTMRLFAKLQRADGYIPHDLGKAQINCPSDGTTAGFPWKDLVPKYILMAYRDYLWTKDEKFLKSLYPAIKKAIQWEFDTDKNKDYLPDNQGSDSTYDLWDFYGSSSYTSSIFLASLKALEKIALIMEDRKMAIQCRDWFLNGQTSFQEQLWNGSFYIAANHDHKKVYHACVLGQLNGQWYAHLLNLGYILPQEDVKKAVATILKLNARASKFGAINSIFDDGKVDNSSYHAQNIWIGESYAFACLAIYEGFIKEGLDLAKKTWYHLTKGAFSPWSQPDVLFAKNGKLGDGELYLRNLAIWAVPFALARHDKRAKNFLKRINRRI